MKKNNAITLTNEFATREKMLIYQHLYTSLPDPDKILKANNYNYQIFRDLLTDPQLSATIQQRKAQVLQMGWEVNIGDQKKNELLNETIGIIQNLELQRILSDMLDCLLYGYSVSEIQWQIINDKLFPVDIISKPQEWFMYDNKNRLRLRERVRNSFIFEEDEDLPDYKFIISRYLPSYENPYGEKLLSRVYWPVTFKRAAIEQAHLLSENFGVPFLIGYYKSTATPSEKNDISDSMEEMVRNRFALLLEGTLIEFKENPKYEIGQLFENLTELHNKEIAKAILTVTLTTDIGKVGSYRASSIHQEMLHYLGTADKKICELGLNKLLRFYTDLNYGKDVESPKIKLIKKENVIEESETRDKILTEMGVRFTKEYFMKRYNLSDGDFELVKNEGDPSLRSGQA